MSLLILLLGLLGMLLMTISYACKNDTHLRLINIVGLLIWITHFSLLRAWSVTSFMTIGMIILVFLSFNFIKTAKILVIILIFSFPISLILWTQNLITIDFPLAILITSLLNGGIVFFSKHKLTLAIATGLFLNIILTSMMGSPTGAITNAINLTSLIVRTWKIHKTTKHQPF